MFVCLLISLSLAHSQIVDKNFEKVEMGWKFTSPLLICSRISRKKHEQVEDPCMILVFSRSLWKKSIVNTIESLSRKKTRRTIRNNWMWNFQMIESRCVTSETKWKTSIRFKRREKLKLLIDTLLIAYGTKGLIVFWEA